jgi:beta-lactamase class A
MTILKNLEKLHPVDRILVILLVASCIVEIFFGWLIIFPDAQRQVTYSATTTNLSGTRDVDISGLVKASEDRQKQERWQAFAGELEQRLADKDFAIWFEDLKNPDLKLAINAERQFIAASTYKLFTAYAMFASSQPPDCLDAMIIYSDNDCPLDFLNRYGWSRLTRDARAIGAENTWFDDTTHTTAEDLATILRQFYDGSLLSEADNSRLIDDMKKQIFREGIPAGIPEAEVADKVGFLDGLLHDAGIVYSPKGDFILVALSDGASWAAIAELAAEIYGNI